MKQLLLYFLLLISVFFLFVQCTDSNQKLGLEESQVRIEFSHCAACYECIEDFQCPQNAIRIEERTQRVFIDKENCVHCLKCITQFTCSFNAIVTQPDLIPPGKITHFSAVSDSIGVLKIHFSAPGDDDSLGVAYKYELTLKDSNDSLIEHDFQVPNPAYSGELENWKIENLPENLSCYISIIAFDEVGQNSDPVTALVTIQGAFMDSIPPHPITNLTATSAEASIMLNWSAPSDPESRNTVAAYEIRYSENDLTPENWIHASIYEQNIVPNSPGASEEFIIYNVSLQMDYQFAIKSIDASHNFSGISNVVTAQITGDITPPDRITDLHIQNVSGNSFVIAWTCVGDNGLTGIASSYQIKLANEPITEQNWIQIQDVEQNLVPLPSGVIQSFLITNLTPVTAYYVAIKALDEVGNTSPISNVAYGQTTNEADTTPPAPVNDLTAIGTQYHIELSWTATGDDGNVGTAYQYDIRYSTDEIYDHNWETSFSLSNVPNPSSAGMPESMILTEFEVGEEMYFAMKVIDDAGNESSLSNIAHAHILFDTIPPAPINDLSTEVIDTTILLQWTAVGDDGTDGTASSYDIRYHEQEITEENWNVCFQLTYTDAPNPSGLQESFMVEDLNHGETYYFAIKVFDDNSNASEISNNASATILSDNIPPAQITDLQIAAGDAVNLSTIGIQWTTVGDDGMQGIAAYYEIRYATFLINETNWNNAQLVNNPPLPQNPNTTQNFNVTGLDEGTRYFFAIKVFDDNYNVSPISNGASGKIVYQIITAQCRDCNNCINDCDEDAIYDAGPYKVINPDLCIACGDCSCPWNLIRLKVIAY
jgi:ferredoxin